MKATELEAVVVDRPLWVNQLGDAQKTVSEKEMQAARRAWLVGRLDEADMQEMLDVTVKQAKRGDPLARNFLADYALGKPGEKLEIDVSKSLADMMRRSLDEPA